MDVVMGAVEDVVTGALGSLISKLVQLLSKEYKLQKNAQEKLKSLINELECAQAALRKVAGVPPDQLDEHVRIWAREVRDASYDMEDEIDTFLVHVDGSHEEHSVGQESFFKSLLDTVSGLIGKLFKRRKTSGAIDSINKRLEDVTKRYGRYTVVNSITVARPTSIDPRLVAMYKEVTELVGIEKSGSELIAMISRMKMVSVVGVGGLGKTTLAKAVYDKHKVDFECSAFVPVGRNPDLKKVFRDILIELDKYKYMDHKMAILDERQLIDELRENLENKRYLLVIDDIWETKSWEAIKLALVQKNRGSRVITTTRIMDVAKEAGEVYKLQQLSYAKSKKLFYTRIFGAEGKFPDNQVDEVSDKILKKCDGVPLAIITMASLLVGKSREEWIEVCSSIAFHDRDNKQVSDTEWILSLSYYDLPPHLKTCLLYLSVFSEDQIIDKDSLIWKWVAEGFVQNRRPRTWLFEVGNGYFNELINRSMIQAVESKEEYGMVVGCRVHDMVLDLLRLKSQEENFVTIASNNGEATSSPRRVRRLTYQNQNKMVKHTQMDLGHVRSFIAYETRIDEELSFQGFKLLRLLALEHCTLGGDKHYICLKHLENLLHLRYLGLQYSDIDQIPEEIGALKFLQTLDMEGTYAQKDWLPSSVGLPTQLICLRAFGMEAPNGVIEKLTSLEQLEISAPRDMTEQFLKELGKLRELRVLDAKLGMVDRSVERDLVECLGNLHKIQQLQLKSNSAQSKVTREAVLALPRSLRRLVVLGIWFSGLPSCICPSDLPNLTRLNLRVEFFEDQQLKILGQLPELRHLTLEIIHGCRNGGAAKVTVTSTTTGTSTITDACFQKLRSLSLPMSSVLFVFNGDSIVLFVHKEDSSVSFTMGRNKCIVAPAVMPNLQVLEFNVFLLKRQVNSGTLLYDNLGLDCLPSLQRVKVRLYADCQALFVDDVERVEAALRQAIEGHPNRPMLQLDNMSKPFLRRRSDDEAESVNKHQEEEEEEEEATSELN